MEVRPRTLEQRVAHGLAIIDELVPKWRDHAGLSIERAVRQALHRTIEPPPEPVALEITEDMVTAVARVIYNACPLRVPSTTPGQLDAIPWRTVASVPELRGPYRTLAREALNVAAEVQRRAHGETNA